MDGIYCSTLCCDCDSLAELFKMIDKGESELNRLRDALIRYGKHDGSCPVWIRNNVNPENQGDCTCGYTNALAGKDGGN